jgi:hypothetical protein
MLRDDELWKEAMEYRRRAKEMPKLEIELELMRIAGLLLIAFELRRVADKVDQIVKLSEQDDQ